METQRPAHVGCGTRSLINGKKAQNGYSAGRDNRYTFAEHRRLSLDSSSAVAHARIHTNQRAPPRKLFMGMH